MPASIALVQLIGYVALLLWGVRMVRTGVVRAYGGDLRRLVRVGLGDRVRAFLAGLGVTAAMQSSTATGLMATSFAARGMVDLVPALAVMLGANVGTTLIVQVLSFDIAWVAGILLVSGYVAFKYGQTRTHDLGRVAIGLGIMLIALHLLTALVEPAETTPAMQDLFRALTGEPVLDLLIAAALTWITHSSVAVVLLVMSLAHGQEITLATGLAMVLGCNLGSAINPVVEGVHNAPADRRLPVGNLLNRIVGCLLFLPALPLLAPTLAELGTDPARQVANFHTGFNIVMAALFILPLGPYARLLRRILPDRIEIADPGRPRYLDEAALATPSVALSNAAREVLRMADLTEAMLRRIVDVFATDDRREAAEIDRTDDVVDRLHAAVKLYMTRIDQAQLTAAETRRYADILAFATNLEHVGDVIECNLVEMAEKKIKRKLKFSPEGLEEIQAMLGRLAANLRLAVSVFMTGDVESARRLLMEKDEFRRLEAAATANHFARLRDRRIESVETSGLHLDVLRDAKRINAHIASAAYPVLEQVGELRPNRLRREA